MRVYKGHEVNAHSDVVLRTDHDDAMNTLAAELADFRSRLAESCGHRIVANDRIRELEAALRDCVDADSEPYGGSVRAEAIYRARQLLTAPETKVVCPDWGDYHNFNAGRCSCGESNAQTSVDRGAKHGQT